MTSVIFFETSEKIKGFKVSGHSGYAEEGSDIVCAAISSATEFAINTITDVMNLKSEVKINEENAEISFMMIEESDLAEDILKGLKLHFEMLSKDYPEYMKVIRSVIK
jgi:uncharacterized protein YsxB (DUF464 family)